MGEPVWAAHSVTGADCRYRIAEDREFGRGTGPSERHGEVYQSDGGVEIELSTW